MRKCFSSGYICRYCYETYTNLKTSVLDRENVAWRQKIDFQDAMKRLKMREEQSENKDEQVKTFIIDEDRCIVGELEDSQDTDDEEETVVDLVDPVNDSDVEEEMDDDTNKDIKGYHLHYL